jgi:hypothetical protein
MKGDALDPKGLILEAYRIEGITAAECRSIFLDWALSLPLEADTPATIAAIIAQYANSAAPDHPMTGVLTDGLKAIAVPHRRGGWRSRSRN